MESTKKDVKAEAKGKMNKCVIETTEKKNERITK